jgi:membrane associated rhomboid family serine protease
MILNVILFVVMAGMLQTNPEGFRKVEDTLTMDPVAVGLHRAPGGAFERGGMDEDRLNAYRLPINSGGWWTLLTYQFVHAGWLHIVGNLLVLWVFGPSVEDRFGRWGFAAFYLLGGVLAGVLHGLFQSHPVIGASGSIAAVTGAFLVLFPRTHVKLFVFFFYIGMFELSAWVFIAFAMFKDVWGIGIGGGDVAFLAHIGGYLFGFSLAMGLIASKVLADEDWSLLAVFRQQRRRAEFRRLAAEADQEWKRKIEKGGTGPAPQSKKPVEAKLEPPSEKGGGYAGRPKHPGAVEERVLWQRMDAKEGAELSDRESTRMAALRTALLEKVAADDAVGAAEAFRILIKEEKATVGNRKVFVEAGNLFASAGRHRDAAEAYEAYLTSLKGLHDPEEGRVRLMLALVAQRYLKDPKRAGAALAGIKTPFSDAELHALADSLREELKSSASSR